VALAGLVLPPLAELTRLILRQFPGLQTLLEQNHPLTSELNALGQGPLPWDRRVRFFLVLALLPALSEELAFRGFILSGLRRAFRPGTAVLLSSFLFALFQMNVFQFAPHFLLGAVLGLLSLRGGVLPAMTFHLVYNTLLITPNVLWPEAFGRPDEGAGFGPLSRALLSAVCAGLAAGVLLAVWRAGRAGERG
jgi:sodium transport system permease protein